MELDFTSGLIQATRIKRLTLQCKLLLQPMAGTPAKPMRKLFGVVLTQCGSLHLLNMYQGIHQIWITWERGCWPFLRDSLGVFYAFKLLINPADMTHKSSLFALNDKETVTRSRPALGSGVPVCLSLNTLFPLHYTGTMLPNPRTFFFLDSKWHVVNNSFQVPRPKTVFICLKNSKKNKK